MKLKKAVFSKNVDREKHFSYLNGHKYCTCSTAYKKSSSKKFCWIVANL